MRSSTFGRTGAAAPSFRRRRSARNEARAVAVRRQRQTSSLAQSASVVRLVLAGVALVRNRRRGSRHLVDELLCSARQGNSKQECVVSRARSSQQLFVCIACRGISGANRKRNYVRMGGSHASPPRDSLVSPVSVVQTPERGVAVLRLAIMNKAALFVKRNLT